MQASEWYAEQGGETLGLRFLEQIRASLMHVSRHPASGSLRHASLTGHADVRCWPVKGFPYLVFYYVHPDGVDVWRVLHAQRDIPQQLTSED